MPHHIAHIQAQTLMAGCERTCEVFIASSRHLRSTVMVLGDSSGPAVASWESVGASVVFLNASENRFSQFNAIRQTVSRLKPDAVILWTSTRVGLLASGCWLGGVRRIATYVGNPVFFESRNRLAGLFYSCLPGANDTTLIPCSKYVAASLQKNSVYPSLRTRVVHNAVDLQAFSFTPTEPSPPSFKVGMLARLDPIKDHATLLRAWAIVAKRFPSAVLEFAGDGELRSGMLALANELGVSHQVNFLGWVANVPARLRSWDLLVHSTTENEGLGSAMLEGMAVGRALVATDVGPIREVTDNGRVALLSNPYDPAHLAACITEAVENKVATRERIQQARQWIENKFSPPAMVAGYLTALGLSSSFQKPKQNA